MAFGTLDSIVFIDLIEPARLPFIEHHVEELVFIRGRVKEVMCQLIEDTLLIKVPVVSIEFKTMSWDRKITI